MRLAPTKHAVRIRWIVSRRGVITTHGARNASQLASPRDKRRDAPDGSNPRAARIALDLCGPSDRIARARARVVRRRHNDEPFSVVDDRRRPRTIRDRSCGGYGVSRGLGARRRALNDLLVGARRRFHRLRLTRRLEALLAWHDVFSGSPPKQAPCEVENSATLRRAHALHGRRRRRNHDARPVT